MHASRSYPPYVRPTTLLGTLLAASAIAGPLCAAEQILEPRPRHLRNAEPREWTEFAAEAEATELVLPFEVTTAARPRTLQVRQRDVKQRWTWQIDDGPPTPLATDENDQTLLWSLPDDLSVGRHTLRLATTSRTPDDVLLGPIAFDTRRRDELLAAATIEVDVTDDRGRALPCRLTIVGADGSLKTAGVPDSTGLAVRPGVIYTLDGRARFTLPAGEYVLYAGRGFEYSVAQQALKLQAGDAARPRLTLVREVPTEGWVACDTHIHTLTYSGHGDATIEERIVTLAGEGVELPIATEHNRQVEYRRFVNRLQADDYLTPIVGNEVTTRVGHFNVFPLSAKSPPPAYDVQDWAGAAAAVRAVGGDPIIVLNHARDVHAGFRPFGPERHLAAAGEDLAGWTLPAGAMEVVNSGATRNDPWTLVHDWLGLLNRGLPVTPIGASDSHDVSRYIVGQGRTYVEVDDRRPGRIDTAAVVRSLRAGRVMAGLGLLCRTTVNGRFGPGTQAPADTEYRIAVDVLGPSWVEVRETRLYVNGVLRPELPEESTERLPPGVRRRLRWTLPALKHDAHVVAAAIGPGVSAPYWPVAKPYQPTSPEWRSYVLGLSGAVRIDADGDTRYRSPREYAESIVAATDDAAELLRRLAEFDEAVAVQAASVLRQQPGGRWQQLIERADRAAPHVRRGLLTYFNEWKAAQPR